jgi:hypothetical protein
MALIGYLIGQEERMATSIDKQLIETAIAKLIYYFKQGADVEILAYSEDDYYVEFLVRYFIRITDLMYEEKYYLLLLRKRDSEWWFSFIEEDIKVIQWFDENKDKIVKVSNNCTELISCLKEEIEVQEFITQRLKEKKP